MAAKEKKVKEKKTESTKPLENMSAKDRQKALAKELKNRNLEFKDYPYLLACKPREKYVFHSDYFEVDGKAAAILAFFHVKSANDGFPPFWGLARIPNGLGQDVQVIGFEQVRRMSKAWIDDHEHVAEGVAESNLGENAKAGTSQTKVRATRDKADLEEIAKELTDNAAYLQCQWRLMVKAPNLEALDTAMDHIIRQYMDRFGTLNPGSFMGLQKKELSTLFSKNECKEGRPFYFTSTEYAGNYALVTHGIEDKYGEYVGSMIGDVNSSAVLFETNNYDHHVVICNQMYNERFHRTPMADFWGSKLSQSAMIHNGRVVHIILDGCDLDILGPKFSRITYKLDLNRGDVNMFEMFGDRKDELSIFAMQMQKLILMAEQAYETTPEDRSIIRGSLEEIAKRFYIDNRMWRENAVTNRDEIRVVGIPHESVPKLEMFCTYLDTERTKLLSSTLKDPEKTHAINVLQATFNNLLSTNGDLFNRITTHAIDGIYTGRRVIYDFSKLHSRGRGVAMAQLVNIIGFAVGNLGRGDAIIFHGADTIADGVKDFIGQQLGMLYARGGRAVFLYNNVDRMLADKSFCHFDQANYTVFGYMSPTQIADYEKALGQSIPADLRRLLSTKDPDMAYLRRGFNNVVFRQDLSLGLQK